MSGDNRRWGLLFIRHSLTSSLGIRHSRSFFSALSGYICHLGASLWIFIFSRRSRQGHRFSHHRAVGISSIDNFLRPIIVGQRTRLPFILIFFSVLGGIKYFGLIGFVMGPLVLAVFLSVLEIFRTMGEASQP